MRNSWSVIAKISLFTISLIFNSCPYFYAFWLRIIGYSVTQLLYHETILQSYVFIYNQSTMTYCTQTFFCVWFIFVNFANKINSPKIILWIYSRTEPTPDSYTQVLFGVPYWQRNNTFNTVKEFINKYNKVHMYSAHTRQVSQRLCLYNLHTQKWHITGKTQGLHTISTIS